MRVRTTALLAVLACAPRLALAQTFNFLGRGGSVRADDPGAGGALTASQFIGLRDCLSGEYWAFTVDYIAPEAPISLEYWAGNNSTACPTGSSGDAGTGGQCWELAEPVSVAAAPLSGTYTVSIPARYLVDPVNGNCAAPVTNMGMAGAATSYLSLVGSAPSVAASSLIGSSYPIAYNTSAPVAPDNVTAVPVPDTTSVAVSWSYSGGALDGDGGSSTPDGIAGFWLLCDSSSESDGGGIPEDAVAQDVNVMDGTTSTSSDGGFVSSASCGTAAFLTIAMNVSDDTQFRSYLCPGTTGLIPASSTTGTAAGLNSSVLYRFAVVAQDNAGNRSLLAVSNNCVMTTTVTDFWDQYRTDGGQALPGYCTAQPWFGGHASAWPWTILGLLGVVGTIRRSRRKRAGR